MQHDSHPDAGAHAAVLAAIIVLVSVPGTAFAYLDPGYGSLLLQGAIALVGSILATIGLYWKSIKAFIRSRFKRDASGKGESDQPGP